MLYNYKLSISLPLLVIFYMVQKLVLSSLTSQIRNCEIYLRLARVVDEGSIKAYSITTDDEQHLLEHSAMFKLVWTVEGKAGWDRAFKIKRLVESKANLRFRSKMIVHNVHYLTSWFDNNYIIPMSWSNAFYFIYPHIPSYSSYLNHNIYINISAIGRLFRQLDVNNAVIVLPNKKTYAYYLWYLSKSMKHKIDLGHLSVC